MDEDHRRWAAGLLRIADSLLRFRKDGARQYNRDNKRKISAEGIDQISWLWGGIQQDLPENLILHLDTEVRARVFASRRSGQQRINALFRELPGQLISRAAVLTVAQQDDSMKRARDARLPRHLGGEGFLVLGHQPCRETCASGIESLPGQRTAANTLVLRAAGERSSDQR